MGKVQINTIDNIVIVGELIGAKVNDKGEVIRIVRVENMPNLKGQEIEINENETFAIFNQVAGN